ncbi:hypothetical protein PVK06_019006 [Gossypium arboreum]|uniref:RNase H type-1 domain-containing protein n=1 Tax=Gossypium arboreum TaxID=29729 RepID=A0ABR0PJ70_GOSAR|nr:hypothetical protein PVK06_019006 [Gossypium arboreum]
MPYCERCVGFMWIFESDLRWRPEITAREPKEDDFDSSFEIVNCSKRCYIAEVIAAVKAIETINDTRFSYVIIEGDARMIMKGLSSKEEKSQIGPILDKDYPSCIHQAILIDVVNL